MTKLYRPVGDKTLWPIGSIYLTVNDKNPSTYFGGTWEKISGGFLWGCDASIDNNIMNSSVGHTKSFDTILTVNQIPAHNHSMAGAGAHDHGKTGIAFAQWSWQNNISGFRVGDGISGYPWGTFYAQGDHTHTINNTGGSKGHSHDIPHIGVYVWKRVS